ncbi:MAG: HEAT repeat domain-containing protein [Synechococcaceae bacterium WB9_4xC_028]|jgi:HEAT repeat protein|nr:HEAT repeat domain-containing protein [Synechococcaceae bacterium WB9_4xC_028]
MSQFFAGGAAIVLALLLWGMGRRPRKTLLRSTDAAAVAALNRAQVELVQQAQAELEPVGLDGEPWSPPSTTAERLTLETELRRLISGDPEQRLEAVRLAALWGHRAGLPVLRRGLRDPDPRIVEAAAAAMERHRGAPGRRSVQLARPPRNVARMR